MYPDVTQHCLPCRYGTYNKAQQLPGGERLAAFTRILHRTTPDILMDEVGSHLAHIAALLQPLGLLWSCATRRTDGRLGPPHREQGCMQQWRHSVMPAVLLVHAAAGHLLQQAAYGACSNSIIRCLDVAQPAQAAIQSSGAHLESQPPDTQMRCLVRISSGRPAQRSQAVAGCSRPGPFPHQGMSQPGSGSLHSQTHGPGPYLGCTAARVACGAAA